MAVWIKSIEKPSLLQRDCDFFTRKFVVFVVIEKPSLLQRDCDTWKLSLIANGVLLKNRPCSKGIATHNYRHR